MHRGLRISVIIPCYNEEAGLGIVLDAIPDWVDEIICVDNNSTDATAIIAAKKKATVIRETRQGYGFAYHTGFAAATGDVIITLDGDGTYPTESFEMLSNALIDKNLEFISACRFPLLVPENMDPVSKLGNWVLSVTTRILFGTGLRDSQSGMWVFYRSVLSRLRLESNGMALSEEIKIEAIRRKLRFTEIHIPYHQRFGEKKIKKIQDGILNLIWLLRLRLRK